MKIIDISSGSIERNVEVENFIADIIAKQDLSEIFNYSNPQGIESLRKEIAKIWENQIDSENIIITSSSQQALSIVIEYLYQTRIRAHVQSPTYFGLLRLLNGSSKMFTNIHELFEQKIGYGKEFIYLNSNFHNPSGRSLNENEKEMLRKFVKVTNTMIIEDNPCDMVYYDQKPSKIFDKNDEHVIYVSSFSKIFAPGFRIGYIVANKKIISALKPVKIDHDLFTSTMNQIIVREFLRNRNLHKKVRVRFNEKKNFVLNQLQKHFGDNQFVSWNDPKGGIFILFEFNDSTSIDQLAEIMKYKFGIIIDHDKFSYLDKKSRSKTRINFVSPSEQEMDYTISSLQKSWEILKSEGG